MPSNARQQRERKRGKLIAPYSPTVRRAAERSRWNRERKSHGFESRVQKPSSEGDIPMQERQLRRKLTHGYICPKKSSLTAPAQKGAFRPTISERKKMRKVRERRRRRKRRQHQATEKKERRKEGRKDYIKARQESSFSYNTHTRARTHAGRKKGRKEEDGGCAAGSKEG